MEKKVILLNGPSSSGKSTLADILQKELAERNKGNYEVVSIDDFLAMNTEEVIYEDDVFDISLKLCDKANELLSKHQGLIIDHVITSERIFEQLHRSLKESDMYLIQVTCPLEELERREIERENRKLGSARASYEYLFPQSGYDLTIDTFEASLVECANQIIKGVASK